MVVVQLHNGEPKAAAVVLDATGDHAASSEAVPMDEPVTLRVLEDASGARAAHGLKHGDYLRYRRYCTRRVSRLRTACSARSKPSSQPPYLRQTALTAQLLRANPRALAIPLVLAERAWAHAMDAKTTQPAGPARARRVAIAKLRMAVTYAEELVMLAKQVAEEEAVLDAEAYLRSMTAALALEQEKWAVALASYQTAERIYTGMAGVRAGTVAADVYERKVEEVRQGMRFCRYNLERGGEEVLEELGGGDEVLNGKIEAALAEARKRKAQGFGEVEWCGRSIELGGEKIREVVLMAEGEKHVGGTVEEFDRAFLKFNEALRVVNDERREFEKVGGARVAELELLGGYLMYYKLMLTVKRNLGLVEALRGKRGKPEDFVRLFDNLISNLSDVLALPGVQDDAAVCMEVEGRRRLFKAYRCFYLANCYLAAERQAEAAALLDRVAVHAADVPAEYKQEGTKIVEESRGIKCRAQALAYLKDAKKEHGYRRMIDHLGEFEAFGGVGGEGKVIVDMPPGLEAVPCKPVLFDLAIDGVRFPEGKAKEVVVEKEPEKEPATEGTFAGSRFGRWWSGKG